MSCHFSLQDRFQRCAMSCQDKVHDEVGPSSFSMEDFTVQQKMIGCLRECTDVHLKMIPQMEKRLAEAVKDAKANVPK